MKSDCATMANAAALFVSIPGGSEDNRAGAGLGRGTGRPDR